VIPRGWTGTGDVARAAESGRRTRDCVLVAVRTLPAQLASRSARQAPDFHRSHSVVPSSTT
jgi:hypothetical protein